MRQFHPLIVERVERETADSVRVALRVPPERLAEFEFLPGQHLPVQVTLNGKKLRRTYSICSVPGRMPLEIGVRVQPGGQFSGYIGSQLAAGDRLEAMPPFGQFHATPDGRDGKTRLGFAAGSGITPVISIMRATLENEKDSRFVLFYGNRSQRTTMFIDDLYALKNRFLGRVQLYFLFSREEQEFPIFSGRLDAAKVNELLDKFCVGLEPDEAFICGPDTMIDTVQRTLEERGMDRQAVHAERYGAPRRRQAEPRPAAATGASKRLAGVTVIMDGHRKSFDMPESSDNIVDAAAEQGIELPYSCKGGVCATCRTWLAEGEVRMASNYGLEPWEVEKGFVLACQSRPLTESVVLDYDKV
jgi:ring-1,2-phenylacetyl-CoA epoxidase subunit PaaE